MPGMPGMRGMPGIPRYSESPGIGITEEVTDAVVRKIKG